MADKKATLNQSLSLIAGFQTSNPQLYQALKSMLIDISASFDELFPAVAALQETVSSAAPVPRKPLTFNFELRPLSIHLFWTSDDSNAIFFELREGTVWDTGTFITRTPSLSADVQPSAGYLKHYMLRSVNVDGIFSTDFLPLDVPIPAIGSMTLAPVVVDNNVLLYWNEPTSAFEINYYQVTKDGIIIAIVDATFANIFEASSGVFTYGVTAFDVFGNQSAESTVLLTVNNPPDFEFEDDYLSTLNGLCTNVLLYLGRLLCCESDADTWQSHFTSNGWASPQNQVNAGFDIYIQPDLLTGSYQEEHDFGVVVDNVIFSSIYSVNTLAGSVLISATIEGKVNIGDPWSAPVAGFALFFSSVRYVRITFTFTPANTDSLIEFYNLRFTLSTKREMDSGKLDVLAADYATGGTFVAFNKAFKDVKSITITPNTILDLSSVTNFADIPNPVGFKVIVVDGTGNPVDCSVGWKARGIV